jgi:hypothetical protein
VRIALGAVLLVAVSGCSHMPHWPWHHQPPASPELVNELTISAAQGTPVAGFTQYWQRNTLVLDLQGIGGIGGIALRPRADTTWPVRLALRVMPGAVGQLEVRADQRVVFPVTAAGTTPVTLELPPEVYSAKTVQMTVDWGPQG